MTRLKLAALAAACFAAPAMAQQVTFMTGPQGGSWIPLGGALKGMWEKAVPGLQITQTPGAGIANVRGVDEGKAQIGFGNSSTTVDGLEGRAPYPKKVTKVCQLANLYPQYFQVVAALDSKVNSFADLKGKSLVTQPKGNSAEAAHRSGAEAERPELPVAVQGQLPGGLHRRGLADEGRPRRRCSRSAPRRRPRRSWISPARATSSWCRSTTRPWTS